MIDDPWEQADVFGDDSDVVADFAETMAPRVEKRRGREEDALKETARIGSAGLEWI